MSGHQCLDPRAGTLRLDKRGRCFWCGESVMPVPPVVSSRPSDLEPVWVQGQSRRARGDRRWAHKVATRPWRMHYDLAYDGGGSEFDQFYRTRFGAHWSAWWHVHVRSWGGSARLFRNHR